MRTGDDTLRWHGVEHRVSSLSILSLQAGAMRRDSDIRHTLYEYRVQLYGDGAHLTLPYLTMHLLLVATLFVYGRFSPACRLRSLVPFHRPPRRSRPVPTRGRPVLQVLLHVAVALAAVSGRGRDTNVKLMHDCETAPLLMR